MRVGLFLAAQYAAGDNPRRRLDELLEQVRLARDLGFDSVFTHLVFRVQWPGLPQAHALQTLELLAKEVLPRVQPA